MVDATAADFAKRLIAACLGKKVAILTHNRADTDGLSSAYALSKLIPDSVVCAEEEMNEGAKLLAEELEIQTTEFSSLKKSGGKSGIDGIITVDTSAYTLVPDAKEQNIIAIIDHHRPEGKDMQAPLEFIDSSSPSTAELIAEMYFALGKPIEREAAYALSVGIISDGARFKSARLHTFETLAKLMKVAEADYQELMIFAEPDPAPEAKVAMLNAMQKIRYIYAAGYLIATSEASSNESDAASLISEAADVAFVAKWKDKGQETRISARGRKSVAVPLNEVMGEVGKRLGGAGGGHAKAAGASVKVHTDDALRECIEVFIEIAGRY